MWISVLIMAETWGVPPWEIEERRGALKWSRRFSILQAARSQKAEKDKNAINSKRRRP